MSSIRTCQNSVAEGYTTANWSWVSVVCSSSLQNVTSTVRLAVTMTTTESAIRVKAATHSIQPNLLAWVRW